MSHVEFVHFPGQPTAKARTTARLNPNIRNSKLIKMQVCNSKLHEATLNLLLILYLGQNCGLNQILEWIWTYIMWNKWSYYQIMGYQKISRLSRRKTRPKISNRSRIHITRIIEQFNLCQLFRWKRLWIWTQPNSGTWFHFDFPTIIFFLKKFF